MQDHVNPSDVPCGLWQTEHLRVQRQSSRKQSMRAPTSDLTGGRGVSEVKAEFQAMGWAPIENTDHDYGTDLFVQALDERHFDLGVLVGVQVKTGPSFFDEPRRDDSGNITGWWYREGDDDHFDYWSRHTLPHLLVLRDLERHTTYWVEVKPSAIVSTGIGNKILIPADQVLGKSNWDRLMQIVAAQRVTPPLEGTSWAASSLNLAPSQKLRFALLAPRLVAPHRNRGHQTPVDAYEAVALITSGRVRDLKIQAETHASVPDPVTDAAGSPDWLWRFVSRLWAWCTEAPGDRLDVLIDEARSPTQRAAAVVCAACVALDNDRYNEAFDLLDSEIARDQASPIDSAWLKVQRARVQADTGNIQAARDDALTASKALSNGADDVTASAIAAAAANILWRTEDWATRGVADVLRSNDTAVSWWRAQTISTSLIDASVRAFSEWAEDQSTRFVFEDVLHNGLFSAALTSHLAGDHGSWCANTSLVAKHQMMAASADDHDAVRRLGSGLEDLRQCGDTSALALAGRRVLRHGPLDALERPLTAVDRSSWSDTTIATNLQLWELCGDALHPAAAAKATQRCLECVSDEPPAFIARQSRPGGHDKLVLGALSTLLLATDKDVHADVLAMILTSFDRLAELSSRSVLYSAIDNLQFHEIESDQVHRLVDKVAGVKDRELRASLLRILLEEGSDVARELLLDEAEHADSNALAALTPLTIMSADGARRCISMCTDRVEAIVRNAAESHHTASTFDSGKALAVLNLAFPEFANWDVLWALLSDSRVLVDDKAGACHRLAGLADRLPPKQREDLAQLLDQIVSRPDLPTFPGRQPSSGDGLAFRLGLSIGAFDSARIHQRLAELAMGSASDRRELATAMGAMDDPAICACLALLTVDGDRLVRSAAIAATAWRVARQVADGSEWFVMSRHATGDGVLGPIAVLRGLSGHVTADDHRFDALLNDLANHRMGRVRRAVVDVRPDTAHDCP